MDHCEKEPPELLIQGIHEFNLGLYYECHETLEELWLTEPAAVRELYQGILQVGVALYKQRQANYRGAVNLLRRALTHLATSSPICQDVDVEQLIKDSQAVLDQLLELGPDRITELDSALLPKVRRAPNPTTDTVL